MIMKPSYFRNKKSGIWIIYICILVIYTVTSLLLVQYHEAWRDESQAWVLVKNSTIPEIFGLCASEGHPCLWFLFLYPFTRLGFSFYNFSYISVAIMFFAALIWLARSPFGPVTNICVLLSPLFFYYNPVVCRIYSVVMIVLLLLCCLWKNRQDHPLYYGILVALLIQTHVLMSGLAIGMMADMTLDIKERDRDSMRKRVAGLLLPVMSMILLILELKQNSGTETYLKVNIESILANVRLRHIYEVLNSFTSKFGTITGWIILVLMMSFLIYGTVRYVKDAAFRDAYRREGIVILCAVAVYAAVMFFVRSADHIQIAIIFWMFILFLCWACCTEDRDEKYERLCSRFLILICILAMPTCLYTDPVYDINGQYSGGKEMVSLINDSVPEGSVIVLKNDMFSTSIYAYLSEPEGRYYIWDIENVGEYTIHKWGKVKERSLKDSEVPEYIRDDFKDRMYKDVYFVSASEIPPAEGVEMIVRNSSPSKWNENYCLYHIEL